MELKDVSQAINEDRVVRFENAKYIVCGYKIEKRKGKKYYSVGLRDMNANCVRWVALEKVESNGKCT